MYGKSDHHFLGRLTQEPVLRKTEAQPPQSYLFFDLAINQYPILGADGQKKELPAEYVRFVANNATAEYLAKYAHKGDILDTWANMSIKKTEKEKDGKTFVYSDPLFHVIPRRVDLIGRTTLTGAETAPAAPPTAPVPQPPEHGFSAPTDAPATSAEDETIEAISTLPF